MSDEYLKLIRELEAELASAKAVIEAARSQYYSCHPQCPAFGTPQLSIKCQCNPVKRALAAYDARGK